MNNRETFWCIFFLFLTFYRNLIETVFLFYIFWEKEPHGTSTVAICFITFKFLVFMSYLLKQKLNLSNWIIIRFIALLIMCSRFNIHSLLRCGGYWFFFVFLQSPSFILLWLFVKRKVTLIRHTLYEKEKVI